MDQNIPQNKPRKLVRLDFQKLIQNGDTKDDTVIEFQLKANWALGIHITPVKGPFKCRSFFWWGTRVRITICFQAYCIIRKWVNYNFYSKRIQHSRRIENLVVQLLNKPNLYRFTGKETIPCDAIQYSTTVPSLHSLFLLLSHYHHHHQQYIYTCVFVLIVLQLFYIYLLDCHWSQVWTVK